MVNFLYYALSFIAIITIIVFVHELGHYLAARRAGVKVMKFSIGMGPEVVGFTDKHGTRWCISMIPLGGFVMMFGDENIASTNADDELFEKLSDEEKGLSFHSKTHWQKIWISFSGPFANYIYAFVVMVLVFTFCGVPTKTTQIWKVDSKSPAGIAGIMEGDTILSIDGTEVKKTHEVPVAINKSKNDIVDLVVERANQKLTFKVKPLEKENASIFGKSKKQRQIGVIFDSSKYEKVSFVDAVKTSFNECVAATLSMFGLFKKLFSGKQSIDSLGGVVYMASVAGDMAKSGSFITLLMFTVTLSLNLGFLNLLPLPVVDGGNILFNLIEKIMGRPINRKIMEYIVTIGAVFLILLMIATTINDILRLDYIKNLLKTFIR